MTNRVLRTTRIQAAGMVSALIAIGAFVTIPIPLSPAPIVLQNLFVLLAGLLLPPGWALASVGAYLVLGAVGLPIFAGATGGLAHLVGPTGGYLAGFAAAAPLVSVVSGSERSTLRATAAVVVGITVTYAIGVPWLARVANLDRTTALAVGVVPFLPGDVVKGAIAIAISRTIPEQTWQNLRSGT